MHKAQMNITIDKDLANFLKTFSISQRLSVSELINQLAYNLKQNQDNQGMETILSSPEFYKSLLRTLENSRTGKTKWYAANDTTKRSDSICK